MTDVARDQGSRLLAGRYRLVERIDRGGAGEVWRARDERLDRDVAVKLLDRHADEAFRERFAREARRAASVSHPNVVTVHDEGRDRGDAFMVMEHVPGRTLRELIADRGPLPSHETARIVDQIASALDAAHEAGVIHCDVKPANVIVSESGHVKLADFGVAVAAADAAERELVGTARYVAPERIEGKPPTPRTDVYGLGLVAYELLAGRPAFQGVENEDLLRMRLEGPPPSLGAMRLGLPPDVDDVVRKALERDPGARWESAGAFARALRSAAERGDDTRPLIAPMPLARGTGLAMPRAKTVVALAAIALLLVAAVALFASFPRTGSSGPVATQPPGATTAPGAVTFRAPNVVGTRLDKAIEELRDAGFGVVSWDFRTGGGQPCTVLSQRPAAGVTAQRGQPASLVYASGRNCTND